MWARNAYWWPFSGEESFQVLIWSNKFRMNGIQKMIHVEKMMPKTNPQLKMWKRKKIHFRSYCDLELVIGWKLMQRFFKTSKIFTFNNIICIKSHLTSSSWSEKKSNLGIFSKTTWLKKVNYHFYFPMFKIWCLCFRTLF